MTGLTQEGDFPTGLTQEGDFPTGLTQKGDFATGLTQETELTQKQTERFGWRGAGGGDLQVKHQVQIFNRYGIYKALPC